MRLPKRDLLRVVQVGNGIVDVLSGGTANIAFLATGSGGMEIADTDLNSSTFTGAVSGFGGMIHTNRKLFIDLIGVTSAPTPLASAARKEWEAAHSQFRAAAT